MVHLFIRTPAGNGYTTPEAMQRVDEHIQKLGAMFVWVPSAKRIRQQPDGTREVIAFGTTSVDMVKQVLTYHYGLKITKEETEK